MARIKVKQGGCGIEYTDEHGNARHALKTPESGPFECDDAQAARLVSLGVAEYVDAQAVPAKPDEERKDEPTTGHLDASQLEDMTNAQLANLAGDLGIDVSKCKKKADYIAAIVAVEVEVGEEDEDEPPKLGAADPE